MFRAIAVVLIGLASLAACASAPPSQSPGRPVVVGYAPAQRLDSIAVRPDLASYTHLNIAFANPDKNGALVGVDGRMTCMGEERQVSTSLMAVRTMITAAHQAGAKVLVSVGGGQIPACSGDWAALLHGPSRDDLVRELIQLVDREGLDGVDLDLEGELLTRIDKAGDYTPFVAALGAELRRRGKLLTCATASYEGGMVPVSSIPWFDLVQVMSYDAVGPDWGTPGDEHASLGQAVRDMALWRARGVPKARLVLGTPFYGYGYGALRGSYSYRDIVARFGARMDGDVVGERCAGCDYITYNGVETLRAKARLAAAQGAGVMVWEVSQDTDDGALVHAIVDALQDPSSEAHASSTTP